jgi:hypothetical protein
MAAQSPVSLYDCVRRVLLDQIRFGQDSTDAIQGDIHVFSRTWVKAKREFSTPLILLLSTIYYCPYQVRKFLLDFARIQCPVNLNTALYASYIQVRERYPRFGAPTWLMKLLEQQGHRQSAKNQIELDFIITLLDNIYDNPLQCTVLSYFARAERTQYPDDFVQAGQETLNKELKATQLPNYPQQLNYIGLFTEYPTHIHRELEDIPEKVHYLWKGHLASVIRKYNPIILILTPSSAWCARCMNVTTYLRGEQSPPRLLISNSSIRS